MFISRHLVIASVFCVVASVGCKSANTTTASQSGPVTGKSALVKAKSTPATPATQPVITEAAPAPGTAEALAQRANTYAQAVGPLLAKRDSVAHTAPEAADANSTQKPAGASQTAVEDAGNASAKTDSTKDNRAYAAAPSKADVQVRREAPAPTPPAASAPATDAQTATFARRAAEYPQDLAAQTDYQLLKLLKEESVPDLGSMAGLAPEDREVLSALMDSLTNFRNQLRQNNNMLVTKKIGPLLDLGERLKSMGQLTVPTFTFVSQAPGFGRYQVIEPARFMAGKPHVVGIYYEVENFQSQMNESSKLYETRLTESLVLYTESSGLPVWNDRKSVLTDTSHRRRHDFFNAKNITLPASLTIGRYLLKVTIEDKEANQIAENTVPVEIVAQ